MTPSDAQKALTVIQLTQLASSLIGAAVAAVQAGKQEVTHEELEQHLTSAFADKDSALAELAASITRARAEGR